MIVIPATELEAAYRDLVRLVMERGHRRRSRLGDTLDAGPVAFTITPGPIKLLANPGRTINPALAIVEACWILAGDNNLHPLAALAPGFLAFSDDGSSLSGAYGERLRHRFGFDQIEAVTEHLRTDPDSRRAFMLIAEPEDSRSGGRDVPCNIALMFRITNERVDMTVINRSNDVIFGVPYDIFSLSLIHFAVCRSLGREMGDHLHVANSMHMYEANADLAERTLSAPSSPAVPTGAEADEFLDVLVRQAASVGRLELDGVDDRRLHDLLAGSLRLKGARAHLEALEPDHWLGAMARRWASRGKTSVVAGAEPGLEGA